MHVDGGARHGGRWRDGRAVALWVGDCLRRLSPMKKTASKETVYH
jgi:hypothetical protein